MIVFDQGTPQYEAGDVEMLVWSHPQAPRIATRSNEGLDLSINMYGMFSEAISIPVMVDVQVDGTYMITVNEIEGIDGLSCLKLEDLVTGTVTPIALDASYSFEMLAADDASTPRFMIHATAPIEHQIGNVVCTGELNGGAVIVNASTSPFNVTWMDAQGATIATQTGLIGK